MATLHKLTDAQCRSARCEDKDGKPLKVRKLADGGNLFLWVTPEGAKRWRYRYSVQGKEKLLSVGVYPEVTLAQARVRAAELRQQTDPGAARRAVKAKAVTAAGNDFESVARAWHSLHKAHWSVKYAHDLLSFFERYAFRLIGSTPVSDLVSADIVKVLRPVASAGRVDAAHKFLPVFGRILSYAKGEGLCSHIVSNDINAKDSLPKIVKTKHAAVGIKELPKLLCAINGYEGMQTRLALQLVFLTFTRANELLKATWDEVDFEEALLRIPPERMKKRLPLLVPLSPQAVAILRQLKEISCGSEFLFPGRSYKKPMVSGALLNAFNTLGYGGAQTTHGIRRIASTFLNGACDEEGRPLFSSDAIERQLAHVKDDVRGTYNEAEYLPQRVRMMAYWADYLDVKAREGSENNC